MQQLQTSHQHTSICKFSLSLRFFCHNLLTLLPYSLGITQCIWQHTWLLVSPCSFTCSPYRSVICLMPWGGMVCTFSTKDLLAVLMASCTAGGKKHGDEKNRTRLSTGGTKNEIMTVHRQLHFLQLSDPQSIAQNP